MGNRSSLIAAFVAVVCLFAANSSRAISLPPISDGSPVSIPTLVTPGDTFDIAVVGFSATDGAYLAGPFNVTFGMTQTFIGMGPNGQNVTVSSSENVGTTTTTDTFTISVPSDFIPSGTTINGDPITEIEMDIGGYNAGTDRIDFLLPITSPVYTGSLHYSGGNLNLTSSATANAVLTNSNMSLYTALVATGGGSAIDGLNIDSFTFSVAYPTVSVVPEPQTTALLALGLLCCIGITVLRNRGLVVSRD